MRLDGKNEKERSATCALDDLSGVYVGQEVCVGKQKGCIVTNEQSEEVNET